MTIAKFAAESSQNTQLSNGLQNYNDLSKGSAFVITDRREFVFFPYDG